MKYNFDNEFRFKNLPDESTPHNAENMNKALDNTSWLKQQLDGTIEPKTGSSIEINDSAEAMLNKLEIEGKSIQDGEPSPDNPVEIKSVGKLNDQGKYEIELTITKDDESKTTTFVLNEPLRCLPIGTKDLLYINGGNLFVQRNVGSEKVNVQELITLPNNLKAGIFTLKNKDKSFGGRGYSYAEKASYRTPNDFITGQYYENVINCVFIGTEDDTLETLKEKYDGSELTYRLAESVTEDLGEIEMPSTYKDKSTITTTDELEPTINLEYVKDTILTNYVEKRLINLIK